VFGGTKEEAEPEQLQSLRRDRIWCKRRMKSVGLFCRIQVSFVGLALLQKRLIFSYIFTYILEAENVLLTLGVCPLLLEEANIGGGRHRRRDRCRSAPPPLLLLSTNIEYTSSVDEGVGEAGSPH